MIPAQHSAEHNNATHTTLCGLWQIWFDADANWVDEPLYLPGTPLADIAIHTPSGGWDALEDSTPITVPAVTDDIRADYHGVSWWSRTITLSGAAHALLHFAAARLRAEVFLDGQLIGYDIEGYTPFDVAIPSHLNIAGEHSLAVRITNPGGSDNWEDLKPIFWSGFTLPSSQDFGGIWQPVHLTQHDGLRIADLWLVCDTGTRSIRISAEIEEVGALSSTVTVYDPDGVELFNQDYAYDQPRHHITETITLDVFRLHGIYDPNLYHVTLTAYYNDHGDSVTKTCGFRKLESSNGGLSYNDDPIYLATSISWGLYPAGPIATAQDIAHEVDAICAFGQNMLTAHRRPANPELIDALDAAGILLYQEPGGLPSLRDRMGCGQWLPDDELACAMAFAKLRIERLWRRDRSRASLVWWNLANECLDVGDGNPGDPAHDLLSVARSCDHSRMTTWTSGWGPSPAYAPFENSMSASFDFHTVLNWPSIWHPQLDTEIAAVRPLTPMPYISGESQNFTSLAGLPELAQEAAAHSPKRRFDNKHIDWYNSLSAELAHVDPKGNLGGAMGFCAATASLQTQGVARLIRHHRANPDCDGLAINGWHSHPLIGTMGIVRVDRKPAVTATQIAAANAPFQVILQDMEYDIAPGDDIHCQPIILNAPHTADLPIQLFLTLNGQEITAPIVSHTDGRRAQPLATVTLSMPKGVTGTQQLVIKGSIGNAQVADDFTIIISPAQHLDATDIHVFDPRKELNGLVSGTAQKWQLWSNGPSLICANNLRIVQTLLDGPPQRCALLMRPELSGATNILGAPGDLAKHGLANQDARFVDVKGDWNGGWAFSTGSSALPSFAHAALWDSPHWRIYPRHMMVGITGEVITGATSFEEADLYDTGILRTGATMAILKKGGHQLLLTSLPLADAARLSPLARAAIGDVLTWLRG